MVLKLGNNHYLERQKKDTMAKTILIILLILNAIVLLGQVWPEGAPPFAKTINTVCLIGNLLFFIYLLTRRKV